ncbi:MAG: hypothetical protein RL385_3393 [Pseudomonadota bacterium]
MRAQIPVRFVCEAAAQGPSRARAGAHSVRGRAARVPTPPRARSSRAATSKQRSERREQEHCRRECTICPRWRECAALAAGFGRRRSRRGGRGGSLHGSVVTRVRRIAGLSGRLRDGGVCKTGGLPCVGRVPGAPDLAPNRGPPRTAHLTKACARLLGAIVRGVAVVAVTELARQTRALLLLDCARLDVAVRGAKSANAGSAKKVSASENAVCVRRTFSTSLVTARRAHR